jgi:DNA-binding NarL/FixJ family response regulator
MAQVIVASDQAHIRQSQINLLNERFPDWSFMEACSLPEIVEHLDENATATNIDLLIIDLEMAPINGSATIRTLCETYTTLQVAIVTSRDDRETMLDCLAAGAQSYLLKTDPPDRVACAIEKLVISGTNARPQRSNAMPPTNPLPDIPTPASLTGLSPRQQEVLNLLVDGLSARDIAHRINITENTARLHLSRIYRVLRVKNRAEAIAKVLPSNSTVHGTVKSLCAREQEVLTLLADDNSTIDIARKLNITVNTVKKHLGNIYQGLRVKGRSDAVAKFRAEVSLPDVSPPSGSVPALNSPNLSPREQEVLKLLAEDRLREEIAGSLGITAGTLRGHISNVYDILGVQNRRDAVGRVIPQEVRPETIATLLTTREIEVITLLVDGESLSNMSRILGITQGTIYVYLNNIFRVIGVKTRAEAIARFHRENDTHVIPARNSGMGVDGEPCAQT